ncbi:MAG: DUF4159 domain-containing protein [Proteobacteria bacterium]|nr:DUF4159 domain-containing protein [Pseudomonadota bacterium]
MTIFPAALTFLNPWILAATAFLPALWFLLRVTPPAPRLIKFPPARFLAGLIPDDHESAHTPWWILLMRLLAAALIIVALAQPVMNPSETFQGKGPLRIVIDNGWASAQTWDLQSAEMETLVKQAGRQKREVYILTTAPEPGKDAPFETGPLPQGRAESILNGIKPQPWPASYEAAAKSAKKQNESAAIDSVFLSHGLKDGKPDDLFQTLQNQGELLIVRPESRRLPVLLRPLKKGDAQTGAIIKFPPEAGTGLPLTAQAIGADGRIIESKTETVKDATRPLEFIFDLPPLLRSNIRQIRVSGQRGAGGVLLLDDPGGRKTVGIVTSGSQGEEKPLIENSYYLRRALEPYADIHTGPISDILKQKPSVVILPDIGAMPSDDLQALDSWVSAGGLLLRFAGPNMTQADNFLTPVPLLKGGRAMDGGLTWEKPAKLKPFNEKSPYYDLNADESITVSRQLLAEPVPGIEEKTWASLEDGTPLITAAEKDRGMLVMVHTTATPIWSDLALSGLFIKLLQRTVTLAGRSATMDSAIGVLQPQLVMDGFGSLSHPGGSAQPINALDFQTAVPSSIHPPGLYGRAGYQRSLNLGDRVAFPDTLGNAPSGVRENVYNDTRETELKPYILGAAAALFILDWLIMIALQAGLYGGIRWIRRPVAAAILTCALFLFHPNPAAAETVDDSIRYAGELHLAYVPSGVAFLDQTTRAGLETLSEILAQRTSVEPAGIVAVDPAQDDLSFFPLIYWPVYNDASDLSPQALRNLQYYLDHGGTILFDTRDKNTAPSPETGISGDNTAALRRMTAGLDVPPLIPIPENHVISKSFYLLHGFPDIHDSGSIWVEENSVSGRDGVSSVIVANNDWASAWAGGGGSNYSQEMALRFGVNLVMYALTGNYKADQVHLPHILERLGQ